MSEVQKAKAAFVAEFVSSAPVGRKGWKERAAARASQEWDELGSTAAAAAAAAAAPVWGVKYHVGTGHFSGITYGARAVWGCGNLSRADAEAAAAAIQNSAECVSARKNWHELHAR